MPSSSEPDDLEEAREVIANFLSKQEFPKVTVDRKHLEEILAHGLRERPTSYQKNVRAIVGTIGIEPLLPEQEDRVILELHIDPKQVQPRFTGPKRTFKGIVHIATAHVPPEKIRVIDPKKSKDADSVAA